MKCLICSKETSNDDSLCSDDCRSEMLQKVTFEDFGGGK